MNDYNYELIRDANVEVIPSLDMQGGHPIASIIVDDRFEHTFKPESRVSKALEIMSAADLGERLSGGNYFFIEDELYDFRDGRYSGFVHTDDSIRNLVDVVGISDNSDDVRVHTNTVSKDFKLGRKWSDHGITVPAYQVGGEFNSEIHFNWNPFVRTIGSAFMLYRLVCENGMRGLKSFLNTKIPLMNRWQEHLDIANKQIQTKVESTISARLTRMGHERASVGEVNLLASHAHRRLIESAVPLSSVEREQLENIRNVASPVIHLGSVYKDNVFVDSNLAAQHPAHLTVFDVYNMVTELRSHTRETEKSTDLGLDRLANDLIFDRKDLTMHAQRFSMPRLCSFSDPDAAFFGQMH